MEVGCNYWIEQYYRHSIVFSRTRTEPSIVSTNYYTSQIFIILSNQDSIPPRHRIGYSGGRHVYSEYPWKWFIIKNVDTEIRTQINRIVFTTVLLLRRTPTSSSCWYYLEAPVYHSLSCQHFILFQRTFVEYMGIEPICRWASIHRSFCLFLYRRELLYPKNYKSPSPLISATTSDNTDP